MVTANTPNPNRIYFDTEFIEDGKTIELLSIGLVREDGATYYAEPAETDRSRASDWVIANVIPNLSRESVKPRAQIASEVLEFVGSDPEFWAYYADYDWVALCQLYGRMIDLPEGWPMFCRDFKQWAAERGLTTSQDDSIHNALGDAVWLRETAAALFDAGRASTPSDDEEWVGYYEASPDLPMKETARVRRDITVEQAAPILADLSKLVPSVSALEVAGGDGLCRKEIAGSVPSWAGEDQIDPCTCRLPLGHEDKCKCSHMTGNSDE